MENVVAIEGVSDSCRDEDLIAAVRRFRCGVLHVERFAGGPLLLQFALENQVPMALATLSNELRETLPSTYWQGQGPTTGMAEAASTCPPWLRRPSEAEYRQFAEARIELLRCQRRRHLLDLGFDATDVGCFGMEDLEISSAYNSYVDHVFTYEAPAGMSPIKGRSHNFSLGVKLEGYSCGTGSVMWPAGLVLGECLWQGDVDVNDKLVLELGCGCVAVPSIVAAHLGARQVVATDSISEVLKQAVTNAGSHGVVVSRFDWSDSVGASWTPNFGNSFFDDGNRRANVVLWADAVYSDVGGFLLGSAVSMHLDAGGACVAVVPARPRPGMDMFDQEMRLAGFVRVIECTVLPSLVQTVMDRFGSMAGLTEEHVLGCNLIVWRAEDLYT